MLDIGFSELTVIGVVALVVLGPERLPKVARTAGHLFGRLQRYVVNVKADINREMEFSELAKMKEEVTSAAKSFEQSVNEQANAFESEARAVEKNAVADHKAASGVPSTAASASPPALSSPSQAELLAKQEEGFSTANESTPIGVASHAAVLPLKTAPAPSAESAIQSFDLGIEPPRRHLL